MQNGLTGSNPGRNVLVHGKMETKENTFEYKNLLGFDV